MICLTCSLSWGVRTTSSLSISMRLSSSNGEPSLTCLFFRIFLRCFLSLCFLDFLEVSEKPEAEDRPEVLDCWDSEYDEAPDIDIWSASKPIPSLFSMSIAEGMDCLLCCTIFSLKYLLSKSSRIFKIWFFLTSYAKLTLFLVWFSKDY